MLDIFGKWGNLLLSEALPNALEAGYDQTVHLLAATADDLAQKWSPPYAAAVQICQTADDLTDCETERVKLRDLVISELLKVTGLKHVIEFAIKVWHSIPEAVRAFVHAALESGAALKDLLTEPSVANAIRLVSTLSAASFDAVVGLFEAVWRGDVTPARMLEWMNGLGSSVGDAALGALRSLGLSALADAIEDSGLELPALIPADVLDAVRAIESVASDLWHGDIEAVAGDVADFLAEKGDVIPIPGAGAIEAVALAPVNAVVDVASTVIGWFD